MATKTETKQSARLTKAERARAVQEVEHSLRMEGQELTPETKADMQLYVAGVISSDEGLERALARHRRV
ncbi:tRNA U54 and U55 pseudouridine synthase Pus10 [Micrococcus cohnii]|uniref:tRNA U54 and U55 pseudouridine synthase Pus10 n=1 Tax=Micrococcus cohnii TaxID=993416 RepID=A0A7W7M265_9MICC|nr:antitoxin VbhA family protein [Micrococcus cohnii]MBB4734718.1 tRNA U54 and U55 pseudouridine synthase Pus10 [Micrococcus cohnii]